MTMPPVAADKRDERLATATTEPGNVHAARFVYTMASALGKGYEWNLVSVIDNLSADGDKCASYFQANRYAAGRTWAACMEVADLTFGEVQGPMVATEFDVWCNGPDEHGWRLGLHVVGGDSRRIKTGEARNEWAEAACGVRVSQNGGDPNFKWRDAAYLSDFWQSGIRLDGSADPANPAHRGVWFSGGHFVVGFDFAGATFQAPIRLAAGQYITLEATDTVRVGFEDGRVRIMNGDRSLFEIDINTGDVYARGRFLMMEPA